MKAILSNLTKHEYNTKVAELRTASVDFVFKKNDANSNLYHLQRCIFATALLSANGDVGDYGQYSTKRSTQHRQISTQLYRAIDNCRWDKFDVWFENECAYGRALDKYDWAILSSESLDTGFRFKEGFS
jgi:hypothetical protein